MTMRDDFEQEAERRRLNMERLGDGYRSARTHDAWEMHQAAYAAGQRAGRLEEREACATLVEAADVEYHRHAGQIYDDANSTLLSAAAAIRNRKEQG